MKKIIFIMITVVILVIVGLLVFRNYNNSGETQSMDTKNTQNRNGKTLIIYFSLSGTTKQAAEKIQQYTGADIIRLEPKKAYPKGYDNYVPVAKRQLDEQIHPAIKTTIPNLDEYDNIFIGFPTWWQQPPMIIHSLFEKFDFAGKKIIPFTTSMSTPIKDSMPYMRKLTNDDNAKIVNGFRYDNNSQQLRTFLQKNSLLKTQLTH